MKNNVNKTKKGPPVVRLKFRANDLVVKQGDYGISIYQVVKGRVGVFVESDEGEVQVATLGPGEIIGEMIFLSGYQTRRSATIRAVEETTVESWHPSAIKREYEQMPPAIRYLANQVTQHLRRYNRMLTELHELRKRKDVAPPKIVKKNLQPRSFRKDLDVDCMYRPVEEPESPHLWGRIKNISKGGMRMDIRRGNTFGRKHELGSQFMIDEWGYPEIGVCICNCPSAGHDMIMLDYTNCVKNREPEVVHVDQEIDFKITFLAKDFETFIRGLVSKENYEV